MITITELDLRRLAPSDAIVAINSYPRRFRKALTPIGSDENIEQIAVTPGPNGLSALDIASWAADSWSTLDTALATIAVHDNMEVRFPCPEPVPLNMEPRPEQISNLLNELVNHATSLTQRAAALSGDDWNRSAIISDGGHTTALDVLKAAVAVGHRSLTLIEATLRAVRAH